MRYLQGLFLLIVIDIAHADEVPIIECKAESLLNNIRAVNHAFNEAGVTILEWMMKQFSKNDSELMQRDIDRYVVAVVTINPESRVKVMRGPHGIEFQSGWQTPVLVKVINEGGVTARINVQSTGDKVTTARFYEDTFVGGVKSNLSNKLSGESVEYQVVLVRCVATDRREITLTFDVGQATQDLGFRAELPILISRSKKTRDDFFIEKQDVMWRPGKNNRQVSVNNTADWVIRADCIRENVQAVTGPILLDKQTKLGVNIDNEETVGKIIKRKISYLTTSGDRVPAYVLIPKLMKEKLPAVLCLHQTTKIGKAEPSGLGGLANLHYALELAERGYVTISPDYPGFGDYANCNPYQMGYASATAKGVSNHSRAIDVLVQMPEVDAERIGCIGHSLGGHNTLFVSLFDNRIKALTTSCGFCSFPKYYGGDLKGWSHKGYMPRIASLYQCDPKQMPFDFTEILAAMAPRPVFINAPVKDDNFNVDGVRDCTKAARPVYQLYGKPDHLVVEHPDCGHDFPQDVRGRCYAFFDQHLKLPKKGR